MTVAAVGSLYIVKDRVGITQLKKPFLDDTPEVFVPYEAAGAAGGTSQDQYQLAAFRPRPGQRQPLDREQSGRGRRDGLHPLLSVCAGAF